MTNTQNYYYLIHLDAIIYTKKKKKKKKKTKKKKKQKKKNKNKISLFLNIL